MPLLLKIIPNQVKKIARKSCSVWCSLFSTISINLRAGWKVDEPNQPKCIILSLDLTQQINYWSPTKPRKRWLKRNNKYWPKLAPLCQWMRQSMFCCTWWNVVIFSWLIGWASEINDVRSKPYKNKTKIIMLLWNFFEKATKLLFGNLPYLRVEMSPHHSLALISVHYLNKTAMLLPQKIIN